MPYLITLKKGENNFEKTPDCFFVELGSNVKEIIKNMPINPPFKKKDLGLIIDEVFKHFGTLATSKMLDKLKDQGFYYATLSGITVSLDDIVVLKDKEHIYEEAENTIAKIRNFYEKGALTEAERHRRVIKVWNDVKEDIQKKLVKEFESNIHNPIYMMKDSGARGNDSNFL